MRILVIGSGGREHALVWKLSQSPAVEKVYGAPGNPGIAQCGECIPTGDGTPKELLAAAESINADLTVVGPEAPLVAGIVDTFRAAGRAIVGPTAENARLEGSKIFAKDFFRRHKIPTAEFVLTDNRDAARNALARFRFPVVIKADGLAAGKGVVVAGDRAEAERAVEALGERLVIEEFLEGEEVSFIVLCDGRDIVPFAATQDHKRVNDDDTGPNTGGMGAYCDSRILSEKQTELILDTVIRPTVEATGFSGFLYAGLIMTAAGPKVLEFNVRLGDPEAQPLMFRLNTDLAPVLMSAAQRELGRHTFSWRRGTSVCVVLASAGYPGSYSTGAPIQGIDAAEAAGATVFHAGTRKGASGLETAGGRVLGVTAAADDLPSAIEHVYQATRHVHFEGLHYRTDIGRKGLRGYNVGVAP
ncbi:MAG: phosphoribosylamine--glycine ligase [Acidobacteria bacterium]|nr:MAG: phosphoribosylamine--glycine ligase [Acidobacteriota bacterium]